MLSISATSVLYCSTWLQTWSVVTNFVKPLWRTEEWAVGTCFANKAVAQKRQKPPRYKKTWLGLQLGFSCNVTRCHNWRSRAAKYSLWRCMSNNWVTRSQVSESNDVKWAQQLIGLVLLCFIPDISRGAHLFHAAQRCAVKGTLSLGCAQQWPSGIDCIILYMGTVSLPAIPMISFHRALPCLVTSHHLMSHFLSVAVSLPFSTSPFCFPQAHHPSRMALASASNTVVGENGVPKTSNELSLFSSIFPIKFQTNPSDAATGQFHWEVLDDLSISVKENLAYSPLSQQHLQTFFRPLQQRPIWVCPDRGQYTMIWVNYNISLIWIKAIWGWFPYKNHDSRVRSRREVGVIYPEWYTML